MLSLELEKNARICQVMSRISESFSKKTSIFGLERKLTCPIDLIAAVKTTVSPPVSLRIFEFNNKQHEQHGSQF